MSTDTLSITQHRVVCPRPQNYPPPPRIQKATMEHDPSRRIVAAIVLQAVKDAYFPRRQDHKLIKYEAKLWLNTEDGFSLLSASLGKGV